MDSSEKRPDRRPHTVTEAYGLDRDTGRQPDRRPHTGTEAV